MTRPADTGAAISIIKPADRPGWWCIVVERRGKPRRLWLAIDEAAQLATKLTAELPAVSVRPPAPTGTRTDAGPVNHG